MPLTALSIANDCLAHIGNQVGDPLPNGALQYLVNCLNQSLEEMRVKVPQMFRQTVTANFTGSRSGTLNVTAGQTQCTLGSLPPPQNGCTVVLSGDTTWNEIRQDPSGAPGLYQLLVPYGGGSGVASVSCYGDSVVFDTSFVDHLIGAALLHDRRPLALLNSRQDWLLAQTNYYTGDYTGTVSGTGPTPQSAPVIRRQPSVPEAVWLYSYLDAKGAPEYQLRVAPLPSGVWNIDVDLAIIPAEVQVSDVSDATTFQFPVPGGRVYTIFRALALFHWSGSPFFANQAARAVIQKGYDDAVMQLENYTPHTGAQPKVVVRGYL